MWHFSREKQGKVAFTLATLTVLLSLVGVFGFIGLQAYTRWNINQDFTFLGGNELEVLTASSFALLIALLYFTRSHNDK